MQLTIKVAGVDVSNHALFAETEITKDSTQRVSTARVSFWSDFDASAIYGTAKYGQSTYSFAPQEWQVIQILNAANPSDIQFAGYIVQIERVILAGQQTKFVCTCSDYGILLDRNTKTQTWTNQSDETIILQAFSGVTGITVDAGNIATLVADMGTFEAKDMNLRDLMDRVCELSNGEWRVDYSANLKYYAAGTAAPFNVSDSPNGVTTFHHDVTSLKQDFSGAANRITVLGALNTSAVEVSATENNLQSQAKYGILSLAIVDRNIPDTATATLRAAAELSVRAFPRTSGTFVCYRDGLDIGQAITITNNPYNLAGSYLIRAIRMRMLSKGPVGGAERWGQCECVYEVDFGQKTPDLIVALRRVERKARQPEYIPRANPPLLTVTNFASTIRPVQILSALPTLPDSNYAQGATVFLTTDNKLYRSTGSAWTVAVPTVDLTGQIATTQITDDSISTPKLQALAVTAAKVAANAITAGKIDVDAVTAGTIAAAAIRASDAVFEAGAIQTADIGDATITNAKIVSLSATKLTAGTIDAGVITVTNLNATNITVGTLSVDRIANASITGAKIGNATITDANIANATITSAKIVSLNADKINAGTITSVNMVSGTLTLNLNGYTTTIDNASYGIGFAGILVRQNASPNVRSAIIGQGFYVSSNTSVDFVELTATGGSGSFGNLYLREWDGSSYTWVTRLDSRSIRITTNGSAGILFANGNQLVGTRTTGWGTPTGTLTRTSFDPSTVTLSQLGERVAALITDIIQNHGFLGA